MEDLLIRFANGAELLVDAAAVLVVGFGALDALVRLVGQVAARGEMHGGRKAVWRRFGVWLLLGLEFELAADIIGSVVSPSWQDVGMLGAIAVIRTFLNYFLEKDLDSADDAPRDASVPAPASFAVAGG